MPAGKWKGNILRLSSMQYILILHFPNIITLTFFSNRTKIALKQKIEFKHVVETVKQHARVKASMGSYLRNEKFVNNSTFSVVDFDLMARSFNIRIPEIGSAQRYQRCLKLRCCHRRLAEASGRRRLWLCRDKWNGRRTRNSKKGQRHFFLLVVSSMC